ncbi:MAG TPA: amino acid adenylation domain-containing protein [Candidatus Angelobacter sp.]|nr:amino acid adenylation domain-containing protein [Candidatus Angelobacter sp.]
MNGKSWSQQPVVNPQRAATGLTLKHMAYVIYTSGSTGKPKGVCVAHFNLSHFLTGIGEVLGEHGNGGHWLALTKLSFDISILETLWTLTQGFQTVIGEPRRLMEAGSRPSVERISRQRKMDFSLFYFAAGDNPGADTYRLLLEGSKFADRNGFTAVWTPERHFHAFGGIYPNPAVTGAAVAAVTERIQIRAGSVVLPLQNPLRVAEEWSVVDNLSHGRAAISFASGWHPDDFVLAPAQFHNRKEIMLRDIEVVRKLWRGEGQSLTNGTGKQVEVRIYPKPVQPELRFWITTSGNPESFRMAGEAGANLLTHLLGQSLDELKEKIAIYRSAWKQRGHTGHGHVSLMVHAFLGTELAWVKDKVRGPFSDYLVQAVDLLKKPMGTTADHYHQNDVQAIIDHAFERYFESSGLMGTVESCLQTVDRLQAIEVDEVACLIDFGVDHASVMASLELLKELRERSNSPYQRNVQGLSLEEAEVITHVQCTPSMGKLLLASEDTKKCLAGVKKLLLGGEPLPLSLVQEMRQVTGAEIYNLYGPTETTIWSTARELTNEEGTEVVSIGKPFGSNRAYVIDSWGQLAPVGVAGELYIGGEQVARGYLKRPDLTADRFVPDPFDGAEGGRLYRTGDLVRWKKNGDLEFLQRADHQVKIRGFRIELGEIEVRLEEHPGVQEAVVVAREDVSGEKRLVAYYTAAAASHGKEDEQAAVANAESLRLHLSTKLPDYMVPAAYVWLDKMPLTANGKLDRKSLPAPEAAAYGSRAYEAPQGEIETRLAEIWVEVLELERVSRHDNFFELGGHSLQAVTVIERMRRSGLQVNVRALFASPTVVGLAAAASAGEKEIEIPANGIPPGSDWITPEMLPLIDLSAEEIERIVREVPDGTRNVQDIYPLAPLQEGMLFHHLMEENGDPYVVAWLFAFQSRAALDSYISDLQAVINRHDILRTAVLWEGLPEPVQVVWRTAILPVEETVLDPGSGDAGEQLYRRFNPRRYRIEIQQAPLLRAHVGYDAKNGRWMMVLLQHQLAGDHTTLEVMQTEMQAHRLGQADRLPAPQPFRNLVAQARLGISREDHEAFFRQLLGDVEEPTAIFGLLNARGDGTGIREEQLQLDPALARRIRERARKLGVSAASLWHLAWAIVLGQVSDRQDVVFGTVMFGRMQGGVGADRGMGLFMNTLPARIQVGDESAEAAVRRTHSLLADLLRHEHASLALAQRCSCVSAPLPLFSALLNYRHTPALAKEPSAEAVRAWEGVEVLHGEERTNYAVTLSIDDLGEGFRFTAQTLAQIDPGRLCRFTRTAMESLLQALETRPEAAVCTLEALPEDERHQIVQEWNDTQMAFPEDELLHSLIEAQVARTPDAAAVVYEGTQLSYAELNARANQLAHYLRVLGVRPDARVAICADRSLAMMVALLAVLKAGGAYVPLDPSYPMDRLNFMLEHSGASILLTHIEKRFIGCKDDVRIIDLAAASQWKDQPRSNPDRWNGELDSSKLGYVIYTSGSTGTPKGVMVEHRSIVNRLVWMQRAYPIGTDDAVLQKTPISFDVSVWELFWPLMTGARLVIARPEGHKVPEYLIEAIRRNKITIVHFVPSMLQAFLATANVETCSTLTHVMCSGEALPAAAVKKFQERLPHAALHNLYGPTEATVDVTAWTCPAGFSQDSVPIGKPIANTQLYILDACRRPAPVGVAGELCIGGVQVARGYLNRPDLTEERFVPDPFAGKAVARMYKTGDLCRWQEDGNIEFLGRNDFQIKLRGFRIEISEIEANLAAYPGVREAVVVAGEDGLGEKRLVAYYTASAPDIESPDRRERTVASPQHLREFLAARLPEYMVPAAYVRLESLPLSANGKLDRKSLPDPESSAFLAKAYEAPQGEVETRLAAIWAEVLRLNQVGRHDNFFELGGHSLLAVTVMERARRNGIRLNVRTLFGAPTLAEVAASVGSEPDLIEVPPNLILSDEAGYRSSETIELRI